MTAAQVDCTAKTRWRRYRRRRNRNEKWSAAEDSILADPHARSLTAARLRCLMPWRTERAIRDRRRLLRQEFPSIAPGDTIRIAGIGEIVAQETIRWPRSGSYR